MTVGIFGTEMLEPLARQVLRDTFLPLVLSSVFQRVHNYVGTAQQKLYNAIIVYGGNEYFF